MADVFTQAQLLRKLHKRNETFIKWLQLIVRTGCRHMDGHDLELAEEGIKSLEKENEQIMDWLVNPPEANPELEKES